MVLDLTMPAMDGGKQLRALRRIQECVLLASGDEVDVSRRFGDDGPDAFIKPYRLATLRAKLQQIAGSGRRNRARNS